MAAFALPASSAAADSRSRLEDVLDAWKQARSQVRDLTADFVRTQQTRLMRKPIVSKGEFFWTPGSFRWRTVEPEPSDMVIVGRVVEILYPDLKTVERYHLREQDAALTALPGLTMSVEDLRENYSIEVDVDGSVGKAAAPKSAKETQSTGDDEDVVLKLTPTSARLKRFVRSIRIWASGERFQPKRVEYVEAEGDIVTITLSNVKTNVGLTPDVFKLDLPEQVEIVEPLEDFE